LFDEQLGPALKRKKFRPALLVGCDHLTGQLASQVNARRGLDFRIRAFVAIDKFRRGSRLGNLPVAGALKDIVEIAENYRSSEILVPTGTLPAERLRELVEQCNQADLKIRILPPLDDVLQGTNGIPTRELNINDLLRRDPVSLDNQAIGELISGRRVLVTGAGGSIGSEICRQAIAFGPAELILVDTSQRLSFTQRHTSTCH
jgi:FlaA1/EpsC-like NDP-sugar epimerase